MLDIKINCLFFESCEEDCSVCDYYNPINEDLYNEYEYNDILKENCVTYQEGMVKYY